MRRRGAFFCNTFLSLRCVFKNIFWWKDGTPQWKNLKVLISFIFWYIHCKSIFEKSSQVQFQTESYYSLFYLLHCIIWLWTRGSKCCTHCRLTMKVHIKLVSVLVFNIIILFIILNYNISSKANIFCLFYIYSFYCSSHKGNKHQGRIQVVTFIVFLTRSCY